MKIIEKLAKGLLLLGLLLITAIAGDIAYSTLWTGGFCTTANTRECGLAWITCIVLWLWSGGVAVAIYRAPSVV